MVSYFYDLELSSEWLYISSARCDHCWTSNQTTLL